MDKYTLVNSVIRSYDLDDFHQIRTQALMQIRADELGVTAALNRMLTKYQRKEDRIANQFNRNIAISESIIPLRLDEKGAPCVVIDNFLKIMLNDSFYAGVRFNLLRNAPEIHHNGKNRLWSDADDAESQHHIEKKYNIYSEKKHRSALRLLFREREYHPVQDIVDSLEWDGTERIKGFLTKWMQADDNEYTREVSRLIFAGGIHRLYSPGCKFDDVPVLIGTNQGEGKSTIVRWLAIHDSYFSEVTEIEGQRGIEQLEGAWICEVAELLALTKAKEQEAVKSYITRLRDKYRKPWDVNTAEFPRRCIFIGTTNHEQFLKDKTGNRRFYPVRVHSDGYWLHDNEQECRDYILQCWAEAKSKYDSGTMPNYANRALQDQYRAAQDDAMEDDWRVGAIESFLDRQVIGARVCIRQIMHKAISSYDLYPKDPTPKESQEIATMMTQFKDWEKDGRKRLPDYGLQRCWVRLPDRKNSDINAPDLPF